MILVTGATGNVGREVARQLAEAGHPVRALVRSPDKAAPLAELGVDIAEGDFEAPDTLTAALDGADRAFLIAAASPRIVEHKAAFVDAAKKKGGVHVVHLSGGAIDCDPPIAMTRWHADAERHLADSGLPHTNLRPTSFMQNMLMHAGSIAAEGAFYLPLGNARVALIDVRDIAAVAAAALTESDHEGESYRLTGPESLSHHAVAARITTATGHPVRYVDVPPEAWRDGAVEAGVPEWMADALNELHAHYRKQEVEEISDAVDRILGRAPLTFDRFAHDHVDAFMPRV